MLIHHKENLEYLIQLMYTPFIINSLHDLNLKIP